MDSNRSDARVTALLQRASAGDRGALDEVVEILYGELRTIAREHRARWQGDETLSPTVLVNEVYLRLARHEDPEWTDRAHFRAVAATAMRQILVSYARRRAAGKRGGPDMKAVTLHRVIELFPGLADPAAATAETLIELDAALTRLDGENPEARAVVECRFFGEMTIEETAEALGVSPATVKRRWTLARAWLHRELSAPRGHS